MRLDKYLAETAQCTRSETKALLAKGRVQARFERGLGNLGARIKDRYDRQA